MNCPCICHEKKEKKGGLCSIPSDQFTTLLSSSKKEVLLFLMVRGVALKGKDMEDL